MDTDTPRHGPRGGVRGSRHREAVPAWFTSSHSAAETCCVEVAVTASAVRVRDSAHRGAGTLGLDAPEWTALVRSVNAS
ncbi:MULTISPECIES: DUF397 domain-containing protein [Nocardiopsidaceae]|uniref:DUF397 domain-containing protein n=1 Tax=Streptomonospora nanhaiensis TaxID=1323731 RepID=A0ABY6YQG9_9ACTN|nr:DUF397 domain-containing protein [Streptomonospora nanhaiensis]WAE74533.1 DUF397 domain-containing protein [Streptomonospora nanhaiensis]